MKTVFIIGYPFSGKLSLACALVRTGASSLLTPATLRHHMMEGTSDACHEARALSNAGALIPSPLLVQLLLECTPPHEDVVAVGFPRNVEQLETYVALLDRSVWLVQMNATPTLVDARAARLGAPAMEVGHPGATKRLARAYAELAATARDWGRLIELDASLYTVALSTRLVDELWPGEFASTPTVAGTLSTKVNHGGSPFWCEIDYTAFRLRMATSARFLEVALGPEADAPTLRWFLAVRRGIQAAFEGDETVQSLRIDILRIREHAFDTTAEGCERYGRMLLREASRLIRDAS